MKRKIESESGDSKMSNPPKSWRCLMEKDLLPYKFFCFFLYGAYGSLLPYLPLYFKQLGLQAFQAGVIIGVRPMVQIVGAPLFGALADRYRAGKLLLLGGVLGWIVKALLLLAVRPHYQQCIYLYNNSTHNTTSTFVYAVPLWDENDDAHSKWTLVSLDNPVVLEQAKLVFYSSKNQKETKHNNQTTTKHLRKIIYEVDKRKFNNDSFALNEADMQSIRGTFEGELAKEWLIPWANSTLNDVKLSELNELIHPENNGRYAERIMDTRDKEKTNRRNMTKRSKRQTMWEKEYSVFSSRNKKLIGQSGKAEPTTLRAIGKAITRIVNDFDFTFNTTITYVTQVDLYEITFMFIIFTLFIIIGEFLESPTYTLSDASLLDRLGENREYYGNIRMFGSLGWALASLFVGYLITATNFELCHRVQGNYLVAFYVFIGCCGVAFCSVFGFTFNYSDNNTPTANLRDVGQLLLNFRFSSFLVVALFVGWCYGFLIHFVNWYIDDLDGSSLIMGVAGAARELTGLVFFFMGGTVIGLLGHINTMILCLIAYIVLFSCYSVLTNPWIAVLLEMMSGANYALAWSTCVNYTNVVGTSLGVAATVQGILQAVFWGFGNGGGSFISGTLYHKYGPVITFRIFAVASAITALFLYCASNIANWCNARDLTNIGSGEFLPLTERRTPLKKKDDESIADCFYDEDSDVEPFSYLAKK